MTFYGDDFRNMLGLEKANDPGDLTIKFEEKDELRSTREYYFEFPKSCSFKYKGAHMYVYSSLIKDSIVGNMFAPIIRVVGLEDNVVLLHCGCLSLNPFIEFSIQNNSSSSDVLNIQASISISPKFESK